MEERKRVYTPEEIAEILQITEYTVLKWLREGKLKGFRAGKLWRISDMTLREFMDPEGAGPYQQGLEDGYEKGIEEGYEKGLEAGYEKAREGE